MAIIHEDKHGLYVSAGGWRSREVVRGTSQYKVGDEVKTYHFGGTIRCGVGKDDTCKRGQYHEYWITCGAMFDEIDEQTAEKIQWYRELYEEKYG